MHVPTLHSYFDKKKITFFASENLSKFAVYCRGILTKCLVVKAREDQGSRSLPCTEEHVDVLYQINTLSFNCLLVKRFIRAAWGEHSDYWPEIMQL